MGTQKVLVSGSDSLAPSVGQLQDLFRQFGDGSLNGIHLQALLDHRNPFGLESVVIDWTKVYGNLGMEKEIEEVAESAIVVNPDPNFFDIYVLKGATPNKVVQAVRDLGVNVYLYTDDLDKGVPKNDRDPAKGSYRVRFKKTVEADPDLADKSADMLAEEGVKGITLLERLLLELGYFLTTGNHLDIENVTLCSGSRGSGGGVPGVGWSTGDRGLCVYWGRPDCRSGCLRSRAVVS